jgi:hypothetical protein
MLFNFTTHTSFPCKDPSYAVCCRKDTGPNFGFPELSAWNEPFNGEGKCLSNSNGPNFTADLSSDLGVTGEPFNDRWCYSWVN